MLGRIFPHIFRRGEGLAQFFLHDGGHPDGASGFQAEESVPRPSLHQELPSPQDLACHLEADSGDFLQAGADGEQVVVSGVSKLRAGMKVAVVQATPNADLDAKYKAPIKE